MSEQISCKYCGIEGDEERVKSGGSHHARDCLRYIEDYTSGYNPFFRSRDELNREAEGWYGVNRGRFGY